MTDQIIFEEDVQPEEVSGEFAAERRRIFTDKSDRTIGELHTSFQSGDLILQPEFQRYRVWDSTKASRLIESVLLEVPLPVIYLAEEEGGKESVIDGQQRLTSFFDFIDGKLSLTGLRVLTELNKLHFADIGKALQAKLRKSSVRTVTIKNESERDLKFEIFERLNTGAVALNDQELRNCVYRGQYNQLLKQLAADPDFMAVLEISQPETRMQDVELVLRFAAFHHSTYLKYAPPIRSFLNKDMERYQNISEEDARELRRVFKNAVQTIRSLLGRNAFRRFYRGSSEQRPDGYWEPKKFNASLYDILMYGFSRYEKNQIYQHLDAVREGYLWLMTQDEEFIESIVRSTSSVKMVTTRMDKWRHVLDQIVGVPKKEPRCFSYQLKESLYKQNQGCEICGQRIAEIDDAAVDHIEQYWTGGKTIPENARLVHRYCNWARPRKDSGSRPI